MRVYRIILILLFISLVISGCKSKTIEEEFYKTHKKEGQEIIYQGSIMTRPFILFRAPFDNGNIGIGLAVFEGDEVKGWKLSSSNAMYNETKLLIDQSGINFKDNVRRYLIYGFINDPEINKIEIIDKYNQVIEANIIQTNWKRVYYGLVEMNELRINAYDKNNKILFEVPYKSKN
ncbi:hypothetical protein [Paenibacillus sp. V4I7]|uniref:hypothetical protein n=1 Tax=Paenibacillus sp. V4I7 TaxID=3042307 RepID=UPI002789D85E|nr:hypothetical protein [Paenibacillus sp. V4I7]MDQ0899370.1 hypothetical protein [Paenibacillus sp. V4I7]